MKLQKLILIVTFLLSSNLYSQTAWVTQNSGTTETLFSVFFVDAQTGWAVGNTGIIIKTINGGNNWFIQSSGNAVRLGGVYFVNPSTGWAVGYTTANPHAQILYTSNGGSNWSLQNSNMTIHTELNTVQFIDNNTGWACGDKFGYMNQGTIIKTTNAGTNWFVQYDTTNTSRLITSMHFVNSQTGYAVGWYNRILKTTNGGTNWFYQNNNVFGMFNTVNFLNANTGFVGGGGTYYTTDGGNNWSQLGMYHSLSSIKTIDQSITYGAGSGGKIIKTTNGGINWSVLTTNTTEDLYSISFVDGLTGWCVGTNGKILKTTTGGITNLNQISKNIPNKISLSQNYPNPFNPVTKIQFDIPKTGNASLKVFDILGKEVATLVNENLQPGTYETTFDGSMLTSGVYFYRLQTDDYTETKRMTLIK